MPWISFAAPIVGSLVSSALAPSPSGGGGGSNLYTPTGLSQADQQQQQLFNSQMGLYNQGNPYAGGYQQAAGQAGQTYGGLAGLAGQYSGQMGQQAQQAFGAQQQLQGAGQQVFNMGLDPQSALYQRTQQQLGEQVNAGQAQRGLGTSPVGGAEYNQAMSNFNIDWQNQQLARATQGAGALSGLYGQALNYGQQGAAGLSGALTTGAQGAGFQTAAGQAPYQAAQDITGAQLAQAQGIGTQLGGYMGLNIPANQAAFGAATQNAQNWGGTVAQGLGALGQSGWGSNLFGPSSASTNVPGGVGGTGWF
jgi:hypothetical protein